MPVPAKLEKALADDRHVDVTSISVNVGNKATGEGEKKTTKLPWRHWATSNLYHEQGMDHSVMATALAAIRTLQQETDVCN